MLRISRMKCVSGRISEITSRKWGKDCADQNAPARKEIGR